MYPTIYSALLCIFSFRVVAKADCTVGSFSARPGIVWSGYSGRISKSHFCWFLLVPCVGKMTTVACVYERDKWVIYYSIWRLKLILWYFGLWSTGKVSEKWILNPNNRNPKHGIQNEVNLATAIFLNRWWLLWIVMKLSGISQNNFRLFFELKRDIDRLAIHNNFFI